ncbi:multi-sensor signal transduction histidine kinase [Paenibacillus curdlanolyticus YK9]|uniref:histidine kinase n=1 Tax=Paenibacillus curdlanolyticus YK9 TaxID=717606 RepID=E0IGI6_9BACL|nr:PAS domain S-box protein [Paenibacillus curdlanolyticus]EFM08426.1 multi-sensor signal transduction histidine kinase [Paenibacillus curdlanolyticus YK9]
MSIKAKLSIAISAVVAIILALNITIYYAAAKDDLEKAAEQRMAHIANQVNLSVNATENAQETIEAALAERLRAVAIAAKQQLPPDIDQVTNEQLVKLRKELGVNDISLWRKLPGDIIIEKSSNREEIGLSSKSMDYFYRAFQQLFMYHNASVTQGQRLEHFWSGPINFAKSNPEHINKWGYYYDGTTNYMINPFIDAKPLLTFDQEHGTETIIRTIVRDTPEIVEISGFDPRFFGKEPILKFKKGELIHNLDVRGVIFGAYTLNDEKADAALVEQSIKTWTTLSVDTRLSGKLIRKSFYPVHNDHPYVIAIQFDLSSISKELRDQLLLHSSISIGLLLLTLATSYWLAGVFMRPISSVLRKVNAMAQGDFDTPIPIQGKDEFGQLVSHVNDMGRSLSQYTNELKSAASELRETKDYLESLISHTSDAIHIVDLNGHIVRVNHAFELMYGWTNEELQTHDPAYVPRDLEAERIELSKRVLRGEAVKGFETERLTKDGRKLCISITVSPIRNASDDIVAYSCISRDITQRKETEERLVRSEKLSIVGQLAAGVAHEIRNPLTTLRGFVQLGASRGKLEADHLGLMLSELDRINLIVSDFLVLSKPQKTQFVKTDICQLMRDTLHLLGVEASMRRIRLKPTLDPNGAALVCEPNRLKQVFLNLLKNGMEAMPGGGVLTANVFMSGDVIEISIADTGRGIPAKDLSRLGEPFFTSKDNGNGLGLMVSQQIIAQHHGSMMFHSIVGIGTRIEIRLPRQQAHAGAEQEQAPTEPLPM